MQHHKSSAFFPFTIFSPQYLIEKIQMKQNFYHYQCPTHQSQSISYFCFDDTCDNKGMICSLCLYDHHKDHTTQPFKFIISQIQRDEFQITNTIKLVASVDQYKSKIREEVKKITDENLKNVLGMGVDLYLQDLVKKCESQFYSRIKEQKREKVNEILLKYKETFGEFDDDEDKQSSNQQKLIKTFIQDLKEKYETVHSAIKKGSADTSLLSEFSVGESFSSKKFSFSEKLINSKLQYQNEAKVKMVGYTDDWNYLALCEPPISGTKAQKITFQMNNLSCYITLGVSIKSKVEGNYQIITDNTGHGCYHMSYDGYSWSDSDSSVNNQYASWYFNQGDKVTVEVNPKEKKIMFIKNGAVESGFSMGYEIDKKEKLYFSVSFNSEPEEVQIVY